MQALTDKRVLLGVTGGIAAYKSAELVRLLRRAGADVQVVMTPAARQFIAPMALQALSGHPVRSELFDPAHEAAMGHIELARWADLVLIAPASADFLARLAAGMADDLLSTLCLATEAPLVVAPAMNRQMWVASATHDNVTLLASRGIHTLGPAVGEQACGETGPGRMLEPEQLLERLMGLFRPRDLDGVAVTITAGPTRESLDPVRFLSNHSSGKMGFALAAAAAARGARVRLVAGPVSLATPAKVERIDVETAEEMLRAVLAAPGGLFIGCAAVADYRPRFPAPEKIKKREVTLTLELERNPDILATVAGLAERPFTVGFAAETEDLAVNARNKLRKKRLDLIAANRVGTRADGGGFNSDRNALHLFWDGGDEALPQMHKSELAHRLLDRVRAHMAKGEEV